jgi:hypothetical protein
MGRLITWKHHDRWSDGFRWQAKRRFPPSGSGARSGRWGFGNATFGFLTK